MKNRFYCILIGILFSFSFINRVCANTVVSVNADGTSVPEGTVASIKVNVESDVALSSCLFQITSEGDVTFVSSDGINLWLKDEEKSSVGTFVKNPNTSADLSKGINVLELKYVINGKGTVYVSTLDCVDANSGNEITGINSAKVDFTATEAVKDTTLSALSVKNGTLLSTFSSQRYDYDVKLSEPKFSLSYTTSNADLSDKVVVKYGDKTITNLENITFSGDDQGTMVITITIDGTTSYTLFLKYQQTGLDNTLKSVTINGNVLKLEKDKYDYEYTVGKNINSFTVKAILNDNEHFKFNTTIGNVDGTNSFGIDDYAYVMIVIEPKDSSLGIPHLEYNITVKREGATNVPVGGGSQSKPNVSDNPTTGGISMYIMLFILVVSLIGSVMLYQKNLESYK